jgi:hypothetical protein
MVLLPIWCRIFPSAKWVVVHRNGGDVAASLVERELQGEHRQLQSFPLSVGYEEFISYRCRSLVRAFSVWQEYQMFFEEYRPLIVGRVFELSYESICQQPELELKRLAAFVGVDPNPKTISLLAQDITTHQLARPKSFQEPISAMSTCQHSKRLGYVD